MDEKHAMLYPELQQNAMTTDQRAIASTAIGLPTESRDLPTLTNVEPPPPSYDFAVSVGAATDSTGFSTTPQTISTPNFSRNEPVTRSFAEPTMPAVNVITQQHFPKLGPHSCTVFCPSCGTARTTELRYTPNTRTHFCALLLCLVGWCCCACFIPYCVNSCRTANHYCSVCNTFLGVYSPQGSM